MGRGSARDGTWHIHPEPWSPEALGAYLHASSPKLGALFRGRHAALRARVRASELGVNGTAQLFERLRRDGMVDGTLGLDFAALQHARYPAAPEDVISDAEVDYAVQLLMSQGNATSSLRGRGHLGMRPAARGNRTVPEALAVSFWRADQPARCDAAAAAWYSEPMLRELLSSGLSRVRDWRDWGLEFDGAEGLRAQAYALFDLARSGASSAAGPILWNRAAGVLTASGPSGGLRLPALGGLLRNPKLARVLRTYLGARVRYDGFQLLRLGDNLTTSSYASSIWHHDRCGKRLKLFILLHDVGLDGRPTVVANRSHNVQYYTHGAPWNLLSRFSARWVTSRYDALPMLGREGGGFVFDTNALHKGEVSGSKTRDAVILEFHAHGKVAHALGGDNPCPSIRRVKHPPPGWQGGVPGFALYPTESGLARGRHGGRRSP